MVRVFIISQSISIMLKLVMIIGKDLGSFMLLKVLITTHVKKYSVHV